MSPASVRHPADDEFTSFMDELARNTDLDGIFFRLRHGHHSDRHDGCDHPQVTLPLLIRAAGRAGRAPIGADLTRHQGEAQSRLRRSRAVSRGASRGGQLSRPTTLLVNEVAPK